MEMPTSGYDLVDLAIEPVGRIIGRSNQRTHAHGDHYGGANYLVEKYHPRVVMSVADWRELEKPVLQFDNGAPRKIALAAADQIRF
jgi:hypothetical protein